jgi:hypothetical protein
VNLPLSHESGAWQSLAAELSSLTNYNIGLWLSRYRRGNIQVLETEEVVIMIDATLLRGLWTTNRQPHRPSCRLRLCIFQTISAHIDFCVLPLQPWGYQWTSLRVAMISLQPKMIYGPSILAEYQQARYSMSEMPRCIRIEIPRGVPKRRKCPPGAIQMPDWLRDPSDLVLTTTSTF